MTSQYPIPRHSVHLFYAIVNRLSLLVYKWYFCHFPSAILVLYHRVGKPTKDTNNLFVSPKHFLSHVKYLKDKYNIVSLPQLDRQIRTGKLLPKTIVVTFDDGYIDNFTQVLPVISKLNIPITVFVASAILKTRVLTLISRPKFIKKMYKSGLVTFGAHTQSHRKLSELNMDDQKREIISNKIALENITGTKILYFAYPYGQKNDFTKATTVLVRRLGFRMALAAHFGIVTGLTNKFEIPRFSVKNWDLATFRNKTGL